MRCVLLLVLSGCLAPFNFESSPLLASTEEMVFLSGGASLMGYPDVDPGPYGNHWKVNQQPQHSVTVEDVYFDRTEVTVADWVVFLNTLYERSPTSAKAHYHPLQPVQFEAGFSAPEGEEDRPIRSVTWFDAASFCAWAGKRLPTESEWERAAKGLEDPGRGYPWAEGGPNCQRAVYYTNNVLCETEPASVGSRSPAGDTPEGLQDMAGNVSEWVWDWVGEYGSEAIEDEAGPETGRYKILRGGGFRETSDALRTRDRVPADPSSRSEGVGFRCAVSG